MRPGLPSAVTALAIAVVALVLWVGGPGGEEPDDHVGATAVETSDDEGADSSEEDADASSRTRPEGPEGSEADGSEGEEGEDAEAAEEPPMPPAELMAHLEALLEDEGVRSVERLSVLVTDEEGRHLAELRPDLAVTPASTTKLVTAAAALRVLGPDYRYVTRVFASAAPSDGTLDGDLILVGSGDPALASPVYADELYPARPHTSIAELAAVIERAGVTSVRGSVRGDARLFEDQPVADGWRDRYFASLDASHASGLTVDAGRALVERDDTLLAEIADDPAVRAAEVLTELLDERGIEVRGEPDVGRLPAGAIELGRVRSPPLRELLAHAVKRSDNHMADGLFRTLGALTGGGTWEASDQAVKSALSGTAVATEGAVLSDGSGLSRDNRLSARMLVDVDRAMTEERGEDWQRLLAVAGESGTLRRRLAGTPAEGRVAGKTGSLRDARALVSQVAAPDGHRYYFAVVGGELDGHGIQTVRTLMDEIALLLASEAPACFPDETDDDGRCP